MPKISDKLRYERIKKIQQMKREGYSVVELAEIFTMSEQAIRDALYFNLKK